MLKNVFDKVSSSINTASDTLSTIAHTVIEKNRNAAKLNRLKTEMKSELKQLDRSYIALGKEYYHLLKKDENAPGIEKHGDLVKDIDDRRTKLISARDRYHALKESVSRATLKSVRNIPAARSEEEDESSSVETVSDTGRETEESAVAAAEEKAESVVTAAEEKAESVATAAEEKAESIVAAAEEKAESVVATTEEKTESVVEAAEEKAESGFAAAGGMAVIAAEAVEKATESTAEDKAESVPAATESKVKRVGKDYEALKKDNRRLREALKDILKQMKAVDEYTPKAGGSVEADN